MSLQARIQTKEQIKQADSIALWSILNLTFLPALAFIMLLLERSKVNNNSLDDCHLKFAIKLNLLAAGALTLVSMLMILLVALTLAGLGFLLSPTLYWFIHCLLLWRFGH
jgi:hypothetical protein